MNSCLRPCMYFWFYSFGGAATSHVRSTTDYTGRCSDVSSRRHTFSPSLPRWPRSVVKLVIPMTLLEWVKTVRCNISCALLASFLSCQLRRLTLIFNPVTTVQYCRRLFTVWSSLRARITVLAMHHCMDFLKRVQTLNLNPAFDFGLNGCHLEKKRYHV